MSLSPEAFEKLLAALGPGRERAGETYERIRQRLLRFFEWRRADCPEDLADRTIDRVGKRLEDGETIRASDPAVYFYGVAKNVLKEHWSEKRKEISAISRLAERAPADPDADAERRFRCLEKCLEALPPADRGLVLEYYVGGGIRKIENRRRIAARLGVAPNTLRIRMHRLRARLDECVERCVGGSLGSNGSKSMHTIGGKDGGVRQKPSDAGKFRRYLLGSLSEDESAEMEGLYSASDDLFEELLAEEDDLIDAYVTDELPPDERNRFDGLLLVSARLRSRVETAKALQRQRTPSHQALPVRALLIAAMVILALGVFWAVREPRPSSELATAATPIPAAFTPAVVPAMPVPATGGPRRVFSYVLAAGLTRDASEATTVGIPKETDAVELRLPLETDPYSSYDVNLRTAAGTAVLERRGLRSRREPMGPVVAVEVPAEFLPPGTYILTLGGHARRGKTETLDQYVFRVPPG